MKKLLITVLPVLLAACSHGIPSDASEGEIAMAEMMGITVQELRSQTPEEHMQAMSSFAKATDDRQNTMNDQVESKGFLPGVGVDIATLPEAQESEILEVNDGDVIKLNPTLVKKVINGQEFAMYGYNGQIPGPMIKAKQAATITVDVTNNIDMETTIHWHGIRLDNANDGVPDVTQEAIKPGGTFTYTVNLPDEGIYWYHPHVREDIQQDLGLYGNLLVIPEQSDAYAPMNHEEVLVLDDLLLDDSDNLVPYGLDNANRPLMGRFGNLMLINGQPAKKYNLEVARGDVVRFYLTNVANTRTFNIRIDGGPMKLVGSDVGRYEREDWVDTVTIAPAERYIVDVWFEDDGRYTITHESPAATYELGSVTVTSEDVDTSYQEQFQTLRANDDVIADIDSYREYFEKPVDKTLELSIKLEGMDHSMMMEDQVDPAIEWPVMSGVEWEDDMPEMNAMMTGDQVHWQFIDKATGAENMKIDWQFKVGDIKKIRVVNLEDSVHPMQHPVHFHGQRFLVLSVDGIPNDNLVWKDTVLVPTGSTVDLLFDLSNPGEWMFHCHIAEHLTNGMMGMFTVTK